jgi:hypothetical protein
MGLDFIASLSIGKDSVLTLTEFPSPGVNENGGHFIYIYKMLSK